MFHIRITLSLSNKSIKEVYFSNIKSHKKPSLIRINNNKKEKLKLYQVNPFHASSHREVSIYITSTTLERMGWLIFTLNTYIY